MLVDLVDMENADKKNITKKNDLINHTIKSKLVKIKFLNYQKIIFNLFKHGDEGRVDTE